MGSWISRDGVLKPATERVALYDKNGDPSIYEGPDRSAMEYLKEVGQESLGMHFSEDSEIIERAHEKKKTIEEFTKQNIYTKEKREAGFREAEAKKVNHKLPDRKPATKQKGGGSNTAGTGGDMDGGFSESNGNPVAEVIAKVKK